MRVTSKRSLRVHTTGHLCCASRSTAFLAIYRLAEAGFVALAPDLYHGQTTASVEEAEELVGTLNQYEERERGDIAAAVRVLRQREATHLSDGHGKLAIVGFSMGGAYALDTSVNQPEEIAAAVTFYASYPGLNYSGTNAAYLCHFAEDDPFEPAESVTEMEQELQAAGRQFTFYTYPGTTHWFFEENRPEYDVDAARAAWERTTVFLHKQLD
jgi:carboxymethylenebutenolidase